MSVDEARRLGAEIVQLAGQNPVLDELARAVLAQLHSYFVPQQTPGGAVPPKLPRADPDPPPLPPFVPDSFF